MYKINDFSKETNISIQTLRYYDKINLFKPSYVDFFTGYRYYQENQINELKLIKELKDIGLSLGKIKLYLRTYDNNILLNYKEEMKNKMNKITIELDTILDKGLLEYLKTIEGIENCDINEGKLDIVYQDKLPLIIIIKEACLYLDILKIPSILSFDKHLTNKLEEYQIVINDLCCEYCLKMDIGELLYVNGINGAYSDYDFDDKDNVTIYITYDKNVISEDELDNFNKKFNGD